MEPPKDFTHILPNQGTRWTGFWRSIDKKTGNRYTAKCKYCLSELEEVSKETIPERKRIKYGQNISTSENNQEGLHLSVQSTKQESIVNWCIKPISQIQSKKLYQKFLNSIIYSNISFTFAKNPYFQDFLQDLAPSYQLPSRNIWYSFAKVCLGVSTFEDGFQHCIELSESDKTKYPKVKEEIKNIVHNRYHFASNDILIKIIRPIVDAIGRLEKREAILANVFKELIYIYLEISKLDIPITGFKTHALTIISKKAREFSSHIYFIALFLSPTYKNVAISRHIDELINCKNNDPPFKLLPSNLQKSPRSFWSEFIGSSPLLRQFAMKVLAIVPHGAACEQLFSSLGLTKTNPVEENIDILFEDDDEIEEQDKINEELSIVNIKYEETSLMEEFFDFDTYERDQEAL
ncbi:hypothetical protein C2G38_2193085 [Gigaspora rosea]|uniref:HAT C-terminal dimerisation domain-containing protein n=1 Tax=Gigaspora rosea TaxID=44941 RepID=A0A397V7A5_9GLOM|nr:hypothetical protein C2G38_2193085 [Gigaspora rosea]